MKKFAARIAAVAILAGALAGPAFGETQVIDATITTTLTLDSAPSASVSGWTLAASNPSNQTSAGSIAVTANVPYKITAVSEKATLTEWDGNSYGSSSLASPMTITPVSAGGTGVPSAVSVSNALTQILATGVGGGTDTFTLTLTQPTTVADKALEAGRTYHNVVTYTLSSTL